MCLWEYSPTDDGAANMKSRTLNTVKMHFSVLLELQLAHPRQLGGCRIQRERSGKHVSHKQICLQLAFSMKTPGPNPS